MGIMHQVIDQNEWTPETIIKSLQCGTCLNEVYNCWLVCIRKSASLNLHPEYLCRTRQTWYLAMQPLKFLILPDSYSGFVFPFNGLLQPKSHQITLPDSTLPSSMRKTTILSYGKSFLFVEIQPNLHL